MKKFLFIGIFLSGLSLQAQTSFVDITSQSSVRNRGEKNHGVCVTDFDQDGDEDLYLLTRTGKNKLHENLGGGFFREVGESIGIAYQGNTRAAAFGDFNNDGWPDLYLGNYQEQDRLYMNLGPQPEGSVLYADITAISGIQNPGEVRSVNLADVNLDGLLDIYVSNYLEENILYLNKGNFHFEDYTEASGISGPGASMAALFWDYDQDGDPDLYLVHDFLEPNRLYENDGQAHFRDVAPEVGLDIAAHGMGVDIADINDDGWLDVYVSDLDANYLMIRQPDGSYRNEATERGVGDQGMGWSLCFPDIDLDGHQDLYVINDSRFSPPPNMLYHNQGDGTFSALYQSPANSRRSGVGGSLMDIDNNGYPDLVIANTDPFDGNELFLNQGGSANWIGITPVGTISNRDGIGARVRIRYNQGQERVQELLAGSGFASQRSHTVWFGLGDYDREVEVEIEWPCSGLQRIGLLQPGHVHQIPEAGQSVPPFRMMMLPPVPNPAHEQTSIRLFSEERTSLSITIFTPIGQKILTRPNIDIEPSVNLVPIDLSGLAPGTYLITATDLHHRTFHTFLICQ